MHVLVIRLLIHLRAIGLLIVLLSSIDLSAGVFITEDQIKILPNQGALSFAEVQKGEMDGSLTFYDFDGDGENDKSYWIKIDAPALAMGEYLYLSIFIEKIEAYYPSDTSRFALTGHLVDFEERNYSKGFYANVLELKPSSGPLYLKISSKNGYSYVNQSLSHLEVVTGEELDRDQSSLYGAGMLIFGMEIIILIINLALLYLKPDFNVGAYVSVIVTGLLMSFFKNQTFIETLGLSVETLYAIEIIVNITLVYSFFAFTAFYLNARQYAPLVYRFLLTPFFSVILIFALIRDGSLFPPLATIYFLVEFGLGIFLVIKTYKVNTRRAQTFIAANLIQMVIASTILLALNDVLPHRFITTHMAFIGFVFRDIIFTVDLIRNYFLTLNESKNRELKIEMLTEEKEQIKRIEELKTRFFNNVSHELRTPLTLVLSPLEDSINSGKIPKELEKELNLSLKNGKYLLQLVNEMLDLAKMDRGEASLLLQPVEIIGQVKNIQEIFQSYAAEKNQSIFISYSANSINASIDRDKFEKILINLVSNAIKYSNKPGKIVIELEIEGQDLVIIVRDQGNGISQSEIAKVFDRYYQSESAKSHEGTGIGLSIVKEFTELHGGNVNCESQLDRGTTFTLRFPNAIIKERKNENLPVIKVAIDCSKSTLLVVEDHADMRDYLKSKLSEFNVLTAENGAIALYLLKQGAQPDLILTDYVMPVMTGYDLAVEIRKNDQWMKIPIIFLTARSLREDKMKVLNLGVDDYIIKPFELEELKIRIQNLLDFSNSRKSFESSDFPEISIDDQKTFKTDLEIYVLSHIRNANLSNTELAFQFNLSERNLYRRVKLVTGHTPASYIKEIRLQKSRLLLESDETKSVKEIAHACGIDNLAHFSQIFKKRFGKSPSTYND